MKLDTTRQAGHAEAAQQTQQTPHDTGRHRGTGHSYAGGMHKGVAWRHAPRPHQPARRNTGPAPRPRPRPAATGAAAGHHEEEHPPLPQDDPFQLAAGVAAGTAGAGRQAAAAGRAATAAARQEDRAQGPGGARQAPPPPPNTAVGEGAALRRSRLPAAVLLAAPPPTAGLPRPTLLDAHASVYFKAGDGAAGAAGALRLAARAAIVRHLAPGAEAPTLADIKAAALAWCAANGPPPAATEAQRHANLLYPLDALRALFRPAEPLQAGASARSALLQRALDTPSRKEPTP